MALKSLQEAQRVAERHLAEIALSSSDELALLDEETMETEFGWVFFWNSKRYRETGEFEDALAGNAPFIVDRRDESVHDTSTAEPIEEIIERYRKDRSAVSNPAPKSQQD
jgi:hypothetical protein